MYITKSILYILLTVTVTFSQPYGINERTPNTSLLITSTGDEVGDLDLEQVFTNLNFSSPIYLTHSHDGTDRIFVVEKPGLVKVFNNASLTSEFTRFIDLRNKVASSSSETGLLGLAFHPNFEQNGLFYVHYNPTTRSTRISEFQVSSDPNIADPNSERILIALEQPATNHNGGMIEFGSDGYLYIGLGDGGSAGDPWGNAQDRYTLLGSILRIDVDNKDEGLEYAIPPDNPLVGDNAFRKEIYAWGLRNPWRFSFDRTNGKLWCGDVGQNSWEEIDIIGKGNNLGWNITEGLHCYQSGCNPWEFNTPVFEYSHALGESVTGGYVYRGTSLPQLDGFYIFGDYVSRRIWALKYDYDGRDVLSSNQVLTSPAHITSFGEDESGELYIVGYNGNIYKVIARQDSPPPGDVPSIISTSGFYSNMNTKTIAPGIIPYSVNTQLWSDNAYKDRYIALPGTEQLTFSQENPFDYPAGTVLVKNFSLEMEKGNSASRRLIETRFLVKRPYGELWDGFSYEWNQAGTEANLLTDAKDVTFTITDSDAPGGQYDQVYHYPSRNECLTCHVPESGYVLGFKTSQLNKNHDYGEVTDNQLRTLNHINLFTEDIGEDYSNWPQRVDVNDETQDISDRARSYLDANCAFCHQPNSSGRSNMDLRFATSLEEMMLVDEIPDFGDLGAANAARVKPGSPEESILYLRMMALNENRMPPIATSLVDEQAAQVIADWINDLDSYPVPVQLLSFSGSYENNAITLNWSVQHTLHGYGFEIEKKSGNAYQVLGFVPLNSQQERQAYSFTENNPGAGEHTYRLKVIDHDGSFAYTTPIHIQTAGPDKHYMSQNYPNPFNASTLIRYQIANRANVNISVFNLLGKKIATLVDREHPAGYYQINWQGTDFHNLPVATGIYIIEFRADNIIKRYKTTLVK